MLTRALEAPTQRHALVEKASVAVLVPCYNEERTIEGVVRAFRRVLPSATIYVYDNNSRDRTLATAHATGAIVRTEAKQGKGNVVRRMFRDIEADAYIMVDGDGTYDPSDAAAMVERLLGDGYDMVVGRRRDQEQAAYRRGHRWGNTLLTGAVARLFGHQFEDMLSGYRVFSRRFVKSFALFSPGFQLETEMTVHAVTLQLPTLELDTAYGARPEGSASKLNTYRDGMRILSMIVRLFREERPLLFFAIVAGMLALAAAALAYPVFLEYLHTHLVRRFPTAILATGLAICAGLAITCGFVLDTVTRGRRASAMLAYLAIPRWDALRADVRR